MELFQELRWILIIACSVSLFFPVNVPLAALAYKVQRGAKPLDLDTQAFWVRSAMAALGLTVLSWLVLFLDQYLVGLDFPADMVHLVLFLVLLPAGIWYFIWIFGVDEAMDGVNIFLIYLALPSLVLAFFVLINFTWPTALAESFLPPLPT